MADREKYLVYMGVEGSYDSCFLVEAFSANDAAKVALNMTTIERSQKITEIKVASVRLDMIPLNLSDVKEWVGIR